MDFDELYNTHAGDVYRYVLSLCRNQHVAEDITGTVFLNAIKSAHKFKGECNVRVWLCQIAKNTYFSYVKRSKIAAETSSQPPASDGFELRLQDKSQAFEIHKTLHLLNEPYKEVFTLRVFAELSFAEIGEIFKKSESWARVTFHRAKKKIKEAIQND